MLTRVGLVLLVAASSTAARADEVQVPVATRAAPPAQGAIAHQQPVQVAPRPPGKPMPPPGPPPAPPELAAAGKLFAGAWTCKGSKPRGDGSSAPMTAKLVFKLDLDGAWLQASFVEAGADGGKRTSYRGYDATARQWTLVELENSGAHTLATTTGEAGGEWLWTGTQATRTGTNQIRTHEQLSGKQLQLFGESLLGGTWQKTYEASCTR